MIHIMKLKDPYFDYIKKGTKVYEIRLNDKKRRMMKKGDFIEFQREPLLKDKIIVKIDDILHFENFTELFDNIKIELLADKSVNRENLKNDLEKFYPIEKQNKYGVVAIKINKEIIIRETNLKNISFDNEIFQILRTNYDNFDSWIKKLELENVNAFYTKHDDMITSILILKSKEEDSQQFFEKGNILKIRTFFVKEKNKGIGSRYLELIDKIANEQNIDYTYLTIKKENRELINFMEKAGYKKYNDYNDEFVYYK